LIKKVLLMGIAYLFIASFAVTGLIFTIKTTSLNDSLQISLTKLNALEKENKALQSDLLAKIRLEKVDEVSRHKLGMKRPSSVHVVKLNRYAQP